MKKRRRVKKNRRKKQVRIKKKKEALLYTKALSADDSEKPAYNLTEVRRGDFVHEMFAIGQIEYRDTYYQTLETESAKLVKYKVKEGDMVKKGDVILTYEPVFDEVSYAQRVADVNQQEKNIRQVMTAEEPRLYRLSMTFRSLRIRQSAI